MKTKTFTAQAEEIVKGCGKKTGYSFWVGEGNSPKYCGELVQTSQDTGYTSYCEKCLAKAKALHEAGLGFLEFLRNLVKHTKANRYGNYGKEDMDYTLEHEKISDIQNGLKILGGMLK